MQVVDIYDQAYLGHDATCWYIRSSLFETQYKLLSYMIKLIWNAMQVVGIYHKAYLRHNASF